VHTDEGCFPAHERRDGSIVLNVAGYEVRMVDCGGEYHLYLHAFGQSHIFTFDQVIGITSEGYDDWCLLSEWEQAVRVAMAAWTTCLYTLQLGHIAVPSA
jgi:hypothetical protein